ncbi:Hpt domain-containing protein [Arcticibacter eurypsychrophilus]|uniref:Hpt domain-containing protein n=1 Tax=Arcticibacter eurypsychrophilus TaxID=1434752 RepID=UPI00084CF8E0|nr:Hpt domain-containing protein [Arcticibacter eurypsychrophilus]
MKTKIFDVNLAYLNDIAGGSTEFIIDMIDIFIEQTPIYFTQLGEAIQQKDWKATADLAHKIKPTLAFVGADELKDMMSVIESNARKLIDVDTIEADFLEINQTCILIYEGLAKAKQELLSKI